MSRRKLNQARTVRRGDIVILDREGKVKFVQRSQGGDGQGVRILGKECSGQMGRQVGEP